MTWQRLLRSPPSRCDVLTQDSRTSSRQASAPSASPLGHLMSQIGFPHSATSRHWLRLPLPSGRGGAGQGGPAQEAEAGQVQSARITVGDRLHALRFALRTDTSLPKPKVGTHICEAAPGRGTAWMRLKCA